VSSFFKLHVIPPPRPLDWTSPRTLLQNTLWHHLLQDQAPIGHFYIEIKSKIPSKTGASHVLTGMSRLHSNRSSVRVVLDQIGLGTFFHDFPGKLDRGVLALRELEWAKKKGRWKSLTVSLSDERAELLFEELGAWIENGSFRHYGGGHEILKGEGAGCAEMGAHFLNLALGLRAVPRDWIRSVYAPKELVGGPRTGNRVGLLRVWREGTFWGQDASNGLLYATPDMELAWKWLEEFSPGVEEVVLQPSHVTWSKDVEPRISFLAGYPKESPEIQKQVWESIRIG
jgi:hypothetical protein